MRTSTPFKQYTARYAEEIRTNSEKLHSFELIKLVGWRQRSNLVKYFPVATEIIKRHVTETKYVCILKIHWTYGSFFILFSI